MKSIEYYDVIFVIENTASCGGYLNEIKTNYIHPALEYFCNGLLQEESTNLFGIVLFRTSQIAPLANCCTSYGPYNSQKFLKAIETLELTSGRGEQCANLAEGLATALVCFQDLEKRRENEITTQKHCILISNSPPYSMPVTECYEYEGKNVEQLAAIFSEKNINLSIISPRKIPILYEIFEKSGGDLGLTAKNYSKDPRHLVLLKGFSLKELIVHDKRSESPPANQPVAQAPQQPPQATQAPAAQQQQQQQQPNLQQLMQQGNDPQMVQMPQGSLGGMPNQGMRQMTPNVRPPMMSQGQQQASQQQPQQPNVMQQMGNPPQFSGGPMVNLQAQRGMNPQQQQQQQQQNPQQQRWMAPNQPNPQRQQFIQGMMNAVGGNMMQNQNSALISQLNQPPSLAQPNPMGGPQQQNQNPQQQQQPQPPNMMRMPMANQQQNPVMMQNQSQNPNMAMQNPNMMAPNQQVGMMQQQAGQQQQQQQPGVMNQLQQNPQAGVQQQQQQQQQQQMAQRERIWRGILEWNDKQNQQNQVRQVPCEIYASISRETNEVEIRGDTWPNRLIMQLMPRTVISNVGGQLLRDAKVVQFSWGNSEAFESLSKVMSNGFAGCVHFTGHQQCDVKILILLYMADKKSYYGFVPNDQAGYVEKLRRVIQQSKITQFGQTPQVGPPQAQQPIIPQQQQQQMQGQVTRPMGMGMVQPNQMGGNQNMMQGDQTMMFNQQQQQQRMTRPNMIAPNNNLRHLLQQQQQSQFRPQMGGGPQQGAVQQMQQGRPGFDGMDPTQYDMNFQMN